MLARQRRSPVTSCSHGRQAPVATRGLGAHAGRGAGVYPCTRCASRSAGGHSPELAGHDSAFDGAAAARLAHLLPAPIERSAAGHRETATPQTQWASTWRTTRPRGPGAGVGAERCSGCPHPCQACAVSLLPAPLVGGGSPAPAASSDRDAARESGGYRVSVASLGVPSVWRCDPGGSARWSSTRGIRSARTGDRGAVYGGVSPV